ncbi:MAG TPA: Ig-like domain-containing protein, partial [Fimbriimonadaceae bacterium]|nr:Ig-like domain-containing protein [Fimbriimonadaceae bacterium]
MKLLLGLLLTLCYSLGAADGGTIQLTSLPTMTVADGRSTVTLSATVRRSSGQPVPDGTQVLFSTTLGTIKDSSIVQTTGGIARCIFQSGTVAGSAIVTAQALSVGATTTMELEILSDRSLLNSANEYVEIVAPKDLTFSMDQKIVAAAGPHRGAKLRYREIEVDADDLQLNIPVYEVRAKKGHLKLGKYSLDFEQLNLKLSARKGIAVTTIVPTAPAAATVVGEIPWFVGTRPYQGAVSVNLNGFTPGAKIDDPTQFDMRDLSDSTSMITAKKAVVFPQKKIQFEKANVIVGGVTVLRMPLYELNLMTGSNIVTDQMIGIQNGAFQINYPY